MTLAQLNLAAQAHRLDIFGALHPEPNDFISDSLQTIVLLGPKEPGFWFHFIQQPEYRDAKPNPLDRWSKRVIGALAAPFGGQAFFPSDGPPYPPFIDWAKVSGRSWVSPVGLLIHDVAGLFASYRGAIALPTRVPIPATGPNPCITCATQPCQTACPVDALRPTKYDVPACKTFLKSPEGALCMTMGCAARRACPISIQYGRLPAQSAFHMDTFL